MPNAGADSCAWPDRAEGNRSSSANATGGVMYPHGTVGVRKPPVLRNAHTHDTHRCRSHSTGT
eukprot:scaffold1911_cov397-Prasinococcus_capsulatus_cf.AAC.14